MQATMPARDIFPALEIRRQAKICANEPGKCETFLDLPPEIRNMIYDLVFTSNRAEPVNLCRAVPPSNALLFTCRQMYKETSEIYREAYTSYWPNTSFVIDRRTYEVTNADKDFIKSIGRKALQRIQHLEIIAKDSRSYSRRTTRSRLVDADGIWKCTLTSQGPYGLQTQQYWISRCMTGLSVKTVPNTCDDEASARMHGMMERYERASLCRQILDILTLYEDFERRC